MGLSVDKQASIVGRRVGRVKWCAAGGKTLEGSVAFVGSVLVSTMFLWAFGMVRNFNVSDPESRGRSIPFTFANEHSLCLIRWLRF